MITEKVKAFVKSLRMCFEARGGMIVRHVKVDRTRTPPAALDATGRKQYTSPTSPDVVAAMPIGEGEEMDVYFFRLDSTSSDDVVERAFKLRDLEPDPVAQAAVNEADPAFADTTPNGTHWKDENGKWCFIAFNQLHGERFVRVDYSVCDWHGNWWLGGVRKGQSLA